VHHRTIQINHQPDATVFQFIILTFFTAQHVSGVFPPIIRSSTTNTTRLSPRYEDKTRGCHCSHWASDDWRENALNMLSCKQTSG